MNNKLESSEILTNRELLEFINKLAGELAIMASSRGLRDLVPPLRHSASTSKIILEKMGN